MAIRPRIFDRLIGLETEYAVSVHTQEDHTPPTKLEIFERVLIALSKRLPTVRAFHLKHGAFLATGGAVWFEADRLTNEGGLIEGSSPEARRPSEVVAYQRAQDRMLEHAVERSSFDCKIRLLKNDRDAVGNIYGAQENYEATFASGLHLALWRLGLVLLTPLMLATWFFLLLLQTSVWTYDVLATLLLVPISEMMLGRHRAAAFFFGEDRANERPFAAPFPSWLEFILGIAERFATAPLALALFLLIKLTGFREIREKLLPFLISRPLIAGAGMLDGDGRFQIADKGPAINGVLGYGGFFNGRPIFLIGNFYKRLTAEAIYSPHDYLALFEPRQRLQIGIGDSNLCEAAEFLRVGTTTLVLDCIESGEMPQPPQLRNAIDALRSVCMDPELTHSIDTRSGPCTALGLQRFYCNACRKFLTKRDDAPTEAWQVLQMWESALDHLEEDPRRLVGTLDWVTKRFLLENAPQSSSPESLKKIDLKYHELSSEGYFRVLTKHCEPTTVVDEAQIERATRLPPADTPATMRGRLIREFSGGEEAFAVNWSIVRIGTGVGARVFNLRGYTSDASPIADRGPSSDSHHSRPDDVEPYDFGN